MTRSDQEGGAEECGDLSAEVPVIRRGRWFYNDLTKKNRTDSIRKQLRLDVRGTVSHVMGRGISGIKIFVATEVVRLTAEGEKGQIICDKTRLGY